MSEGYDQRVIDIAKTASEAVAKNCSAFNVPPQMIFADIVFAINDAIDAGILRLEAAQPLPSVDTVRIGRDEAIRALEVIRSYTDADEPTSYRSDDREGCLDGVFAEADRALHYVAKLEAKEAPTWLETDALSLSAAPSPPVGENFEGNKPWTDTSARNAEAGPTSTTIGGTKGIARDTDLLSVERGLLGAALHCVRKQARTDSETYKALSAIALAQPKEAPTDAERLEAVARIVDPDAWKQRERYFDIMNGVGRKPDDAEDQERFIASARRRVDTCVADSLTKATAILRLIDGVGEVAK